MAKQEITCDDILRELKAGQYRPIYYLMGEEPYYIDLISDYITDNVLNETEKEFNLTVVYGADVDVAAIINAAKRYPMMSEHQVVVVKEAQNIRNIEELSYYLQKPLLSTILVICHKHGVLDKRKKLAAEIEKSGILFESRKVKESQLPAFIIKRLPVRFTFDNNYFNDRWQGIPIGGYNKLVDGLLAGVEVRCDTDFFADRTHWESLCDRIVFTGRIDEYYDFRLGELEYRSLRFEHETLDTPNYQGVAVMNFTEREIPYTRIIEHKHFEPGGDQPRTIITREYPAPYEHGAEPYYPVNDQRNTKLYESYKALADRDRKVIFGGRLGEYRYYDMDKVIESALKLTL